MASPSVHTHPKARLSPGASCGEGEVIDVRPMLARGDDPLARVLPAADALAAGGSLCIEAPFDPVPLRRILAAKGFSSHARCIGLGHWRVVVRRDGRGALTGDAGDGTRCDGDAGTPVWHVGEAVHIDVRGLAPPQPMLAILRLIHTLDRPREVIVHHERMPRFLIPELAEMGWSLERIAGQDGEVRLRLTRSRQ